jgi:hypothetical protein
MVVTHSVVDVETWLKGKSERADAIGAMGGANVVDHVARDGSNSIAITADVDDVEAVMVTMADPPEEMAATMEKHGVIPPLVVYIER